MKVLREYMPQHRLVTADFDAVPDASQGRWAPTVLRGNAQLYSNYLEPAFGSADIVYPTDFAVLGALWRRLMGRGSALVQSTEEFMSVYADVKATRTRDGYNPLLLDYTNTQFLLTDATV